MSMVKLFKKAFYGILMLIILTSTFFIGTAVVAEDVTENTEQLFLISKKENNEESIESKAIIDEFGNFHFFTKIMYDNNTFTIFHVVNDQVKTVITEEYGYDFLEVFTISGGIVLLYAFRNYYGMLKFHMYKWFPDSSNKIKFLEFNTRLNYPYPYIFQEGESFNLFLVQMYTVHPLSEDSDTTIYHYDLELNGDCTPHNIVPSWTITNEFDYFEGLDYVNDTLYLFYIHVQDFFGIVLPERFYQTIVTQPNQTFESNFMVVDEVGFQSEFFVTDDGVIHSAHARDGKLYTMDYSINQTIDFDMFNVSDIGISRHDSFQVIKEGNQYSYIFNTNPLIPVEDLFDPKGLQSSIVILNKTESGFDREVLSLQNLPSDTTYYSFYVFKTDDNNWIFTHSSSLTQDDLERKNIRAEEFLTFYFSSKNPVDLELNLMFYNLKVFSAFGLFWRNVGIYLLSIIGALALIYVAFRKRINSLVKRSWNQLKEQTKEQTNTFLLVFINIWTYFSNTITSLYILFKTNKKRHFMNLIGMTILAVLVITSVNIYNSKQNIIISEYFNQIDLTNEGSVSLKWDLDFDEVTFGDKRPIRTDLFNITLQEILTEISIRSKTLSSVISGVEVSSFMNLASHKEIDNSNIWNLPYLILSDNYSQIFENSIVSGRLPERKGEVMFYVEEANNLNLSVGEKITAYGAYAIGLSPELGETNSTLQIVGLFDAMSSNEMESWCITKDLAFDTLALLEEEEFSGMISFSSFGVNSLEGLYPYLMSINTYVQFYYDFELFESALLKNLKEDVEILLEENLHLFNFATHASWNFDDELIPIIEALEPKLQSSVLLFFVLAVPVLYLALFLILETNNLYSKNLEDEIYIFQSKGMSSASIISKYTSLKVLEALFATLFGFLLSLALTPLFLKIDTFISFNNPFIEVDLSTVGSTFAFTTIILVVVSIPKLIQITRKKRTSQKTPQKIITLFKRIRLLPIVLVGIGVIVLLTSTRLYNTLYESLEGIANVTVLMIFIYIAGFGLMLGLLGIGLLLKELHSILMIALSKIVWGIRKSVRTFSLVEVRADVHLFNNIFLSFFILVGIILPSIICPLSVQFNLQKDAYLRTGADMYIFNWENQNESLLPLIMNIPEIASVTNVTAIEGNYKGYNLDFYLINNTEDFISTSYKPPERLFADWETEITKLEDSNSMLTTTYFIHTMIEGQQRRYLFNETSEGVEEEFNILGEFDYLPVFYDLGPFDGVTGRVRAMFMTIDNFNKIERSVSSQASYKDRLLIKLENGANYKQVKSVLEDNWDFEVKAASDAASDAQKSSYPFYSLIAAEFVISMLISIVAIVFISITNPIKILQHRMHKHDRLKKMGISTKKIIRLSIWETFFSGVLPGLIVGTGAGIALIYLFISTTRRYFYAGIDFVYVYSPLAIILSYVAAPILFYVIFYLSMKRNYARYMPRNIE